MLVRAAHCEAGDVVVKPCCEVEWGRGQRQNRVCYDPARVSDADARKRHLRFIWEPQMWALLGWPFLEYFAHRGLHVVKSKRHWEHHRKGDVEGVAAFCMVCAVIALQWYGIAVGGVTYIAVHRCVHKAPTLMPTLARHHNLHHRFNNCNFGVTTTFVDKWLGTYRA